MTEKQLYEQLMHYKRTYGLTQETLQQYQWALDILKQHLSTKITPKDPSTS